MIEKINDPIDVISLFERRGGNITPLRFRWKNRAYHIARVVSDWITKEGMYRKYFYSVMVKNGADCYEISYDMRLQQWKLDRIYLGG